MLTPQGATCVYSINNYSKQQITSLVCINAASRVVPPMHVFPGERFHGNPVEGGVYGSYMGRSCNSWMCFKVGYLTILLIGFLLLAQSYFHLMDTHHILILLLPSLPKQMVFFCIVYLLIQLIL